MTNQPDSESKQQPLQINIQLDPDTAQGIYSNIAVINHSPSEFILDFTRLFPGMQSAKVHARIVMTPQHAKMLAKALEQNIAKYESDNGAIKVDEASHSEQMGFHIARNLQQK
ncbi:DUF3467 domain-containing protein [Chloroherpeton thalassium]|nr:DUF3467 domain-containing protein [Chloroherpeton thalassium]